MWVKKAPGYKAKFGPMESPLVATLPISLYVLKQSPNNRHGISDTFLVGIGLDYDYSDQCAYG